MRASLCKCQAHRRLVFAGPTVLRLPFMIGHIVVIAMLFPHMLDEPVQDLDTSQLQRERCDAVCRRERGVRLRPQVHHVCEQRPDPWRILV